MIYLDYASGTPIDKRVLEKMRPYLAENFGNPSSIHQFGQKARKGIDDARKICAELIGANSIKEVVFTSGGTESVNMAILGTAFAQKSKGKHIIVSAIEHPAVLQSARYLKDHHGFSVTEVLPNKDGRIDPKNIEKAIKKDTILISVMAVNNETGIIQPIRQLAKIAHKKGIIFHTDACQAPGFTDINVEHLGVDLLTLNGSKIYGPKGSGLLYVRTGTKILPLLQGGGQEFYMRSGTENVAGIVGFAEALKLALKDSKKEALRIKTLRDKLLKELLKIKGALLNGSIENRTENNINIYIPGLKAETLVMKLDFSGLALSAGSACSSGKTSHSHVLTAMGFPKKHVEESIRITLGKPTTKQEILSAGKLIDAIAI